MEVTITRTQDQSDRKRVAEMILALASEGFVIVEIIDRSFADGIFHALEAIGIRLHKKGCGLTKEAISIESDDMKKLFRLIVKAK